MERIAEDVRTKSRGEMTIVTLPTVERFAKEFNFTLDTALAPPQFSEPQVEYPPSRGSGGIPPFAIFIVFLVVLFLLSSARRGRGCASPGCLPIIIPTGGFGGGRGRGGWGGGFGGGGWGGGGGFCGFCGGGGFGGGGGGARWEKGKRTGARGQ